MAALDHRATPSITTTARDLIMSSVKYESKQIVTGDMDSTCLGEIPKFQSPYLPIWNVLSVISINMNQTGCQI